MRKKGKNLFFHYFYFSLYYFFLSFLGKRKTQVRIVVMIEKLYRILAMEYFWLTVDGFWAIKDTFWINMNNFVLFWNTGINICESFGPLGTLLDIFWSIIKILVTF